MLYITQIADKPISEQKILKKQTILRNSPVSRSPWPDVGDDERAGLRGIVGRTASNREPEASFLLL